MYMKTINEKKKCQKIITSQHLVACLINVGMLLRLRLYNNDKKRAPTR